MDNTIRRERKPTEKYALFAQKQQENKRTLSNLKVPVIKEVEHYDEYLLTLCKQQSKSKRECKDELNIIKQGSKFSKVSAKDEKLNEEEIDHF